ncbi:Patatin-like protein 8 [Hibiscus syriacus]|uniref:Patatin-like protein 8 n=1 Tax=Hibiscus syriacus TaxID=106335 RepID=A0A6A2YVA7_HIBSY|nr:Patatin-like protein 8 [Hibiscus syriacus]
MSSTASSEMQEPSIDTDKLSYEIFSILESKFLFGYDDNQKLWIPKSISPPLIQLGDENPSSAIKNQRGKICILSIDSGGMRGILSGKALAYLEHAFKSKSDGQTKCVAVDGGLAMSNPTVAAITDVLHNKQEFPFAQGVEDLLVLSLGTGSLLEISYEYEKVKNWRVKDWAKPMARISVDGSADSVDQAVAMAFGQCRSSNYVRIQANGSGIGRCGPNVDTDPSPGNVKLLAAIADEMLKQKNVESVLFGSKKLADETNSEKLDGFAAQLVLEHQRRSCRIAPTVAFKQPNPKPSP